MEEKYILTLDIGTTTIRSYIYNSRTETVGRAVDQVKIISIKTKLYITTFVLELQNSCIFFEINYYISFFYGISEVIFICFCLKVVLHYPQPGYVEIDPDELWESVVRVVQKSLSSKFLNSL